VSGDHQERRKEDNLCAGCAGLLRFTSIEDFFSGLILCRSGAMLYKKGTSRGSSRNLSSRPLFLLTLFVLGLLVRGIFSLFSDAVRFINILIVSLYVIDALASGLKTSNLIMTLSSSGWNCPHAYLLKNRLCARPGNQGSGKIKKR
jgi:hypothetical protein